MLNWSSPRGGFAPNCGYGSQSVDSTDRCNLRLTQDWHCIPRVHLHISFQNTITHFRLTTWLIHLFLQVLPVQRISDWRLDQGSICNTIKLQMFLDHYFCFKGVTLSVTLIVWGNGISETSSNPRCGHFNFFYADSRKKCMNPIILHSSLGIQ